MVQKGKGKSDLYLNYFNGIVTIRDSYGKFKEQFTGTEDEIISKLKASKYQFRDF